MYNNHESTTAERISLLDSRARRISAQMKACADSMCGCYATLERDAEMFIESRVAADAAHRVILKRSLRLAGVVVDNDASLEMLESVHAILSPGTQS